MEITYKKVNLTPKKHNFCQNPKVSVVVPIYKVEKYLTKCIDSIVNQTLEELEIILIDEGDFDRCRDIIDFYANVDERIVAPHKKMGGYSASCNYGFEIARGEYIAIIESDDYIEPEMFEEMYNYAKSLDADIVKTPYYDYYSNGTRYDCWFRKRMDDELPHNVCFNIKQYGSLLSVHPSVWSCLYKTSFIKKYKIKFLITNPGAYVDTSFRFVTMQKAKKICWLNKPYYNYRIDALGSTANNFKLEVMISRWEKLHEEISDDDWVKYYGKHILIEEYINTLTKFFIMPVKKVELEKIINIYKHTPLELIDQAEYLNQEQKNDIKSFKKDPYGFYYRAQKRYKFKKIWWKNQGWVERELNRWSNINLFAWFLGIFIFGILIKYSLGNSSDFVNIMVSIITMIGIFGGFLCIISKISKKIYDGILKYFKIRRKYI